MAKKKSTKSNINTRAKTSESSKGKAVDSISRRTVIKSALAVGVAVTLGAGIHFYDSRDKSLHDLSVIGNGKPVVVQVHDPSCPLCRKLKRSTEKALETSSTIEYRIADLTTAKGESLAKKYGVGKVTLLLFDGRGRHLSTIQGVKTVEQLHEEFEKRFTS